MRIQPINQFPTGDVAFETSSGYWRKLAFGTVELRTLQRQSSKRTDEAI